MTKSAETATLRRIVEEEEKIVDIADRLGNAAVFALMNSLDLPEDRRQERANLLIGCVNEALRNIKAIGEKFKEEKLS